MHDQPQAGYQSRMTDCGLHKAWNRKYDAGMGPEHDFGINRSLF